MKKIIQPSLLAVTSMILLSACSSHTPAPVANLSKDYSQLERGSFRGDSYTVRKGDTLYFISYVTGQNVKDIVSLNNLAPPYIIYPGQRLAIPSGSRSSYSSNTSVVTPPVKTTPVSKPKPVSKPVAQKTDNKTVAQSKPKEYSENSKVNKPVTTKPSTTPSTSKWAWPVKGKIIAGFSNSENGNRGIDIAGTRGEAIKATAAGVVVYAGDALPGYGNLVIIKHGEDYLSAYAHNDKILVKEQQTVKAGQKIASMGSTGASSVRLHFEIRYKGKSVDPMRYLPK
ncbi:peptidoglycan DD-metalloendopeptidase family protein [Photobacterium lucens]|uniref:peptidoglycan DD-metalloendopeptidase family protein n=1 Tax=Photobacterium lucens TaxID=2562949 RepID=UPI0006B55F4C|nr:peptidoglycan DD-metalloendopeptidase family protein [Photobacterium lucens]KPA53754.1 membrane protein [Photobacterium leiognathi subsp. mandapamensis]MBP2700960.1 peptidoglycan DD-metalloendopeptidase family protein [Vibrio parahaemolyticus]MZG54995.1 LysM peptidoglycan-binding domain-containing protein [Photobacterium lucens]MZG55455.1 LysM peptidoglycan-binding domain-containing protein [Photobacterium lucens]MZG79653.1 LysM peptidoglycan-binding domain-containing protein [Photobacteriu